MEQHGKMKLYATGAKHSTLSGGDEASRIVFVGAG